MKKCLNCQKEFADWVIIDGVQRNLSGRKRCLECSPFGHGNRKPVPSEKLMVYCLSCGIPLKAGKKYCSVSCCMALRRKLYIERWLSGKETGIVAGVNSGEQVSSHIEGWVKENRGNKCEECGWSEVNVFTGLVPLNLHHLDGNVRNNKVDNLMLLCPNCHSLTEHFGGRNKGRGRKGRYGRSESFVQKGVVISKKCLYCEKEFSYLESSRRIGKFCSATCSHASQRKVVRPSRERLAEMLKNDSMVKIGKYFGVSGNTIKDWLEQVG